MACESVRTPPGAKHAPVLEVVCPTLYKADFSAMKACLETGIGIAKRRAEKSGAVSAAVLFGEEALVYKFDIGKDQVRRELDGLLASVRKNSNGVWIAAAFNVMENGTGLDYSNTGYLLTPDGWKESPKRCYTIVEYALLRRLPEGEKIFDLWAERGGSLKRNGVGFAAAAAPSGVEIEYRVCADVCSRPIDDRQKTVTLVSASDNMPEYYNEIVGMRLAVVTNDSDTGRMFVGKPEGAIRSVRAVAKPSAIEAQGKFRMLPLFEEGYSVTENATSLPSPE